MTMHENNDKPHKLICPKPYAMVGAGRLISTLWKTGNQQTGWRYRFNLFWMTDHGRVGQRFSPDDLVDLIKLVRVLSATLADDGCLSPVRRSDLAHLAAMLDQILPLED